MSTKGKRKTKAKGQGVLSIEMPSKPQPSDSVGSTRAWAIQRHGDQKDKMGHPYHEHLDGVAVNLYLLREQLLESGKVIPVAFDPEHTMIAYLHDVMEDCEVTETELRGQGYSARVIAGVKGMTKRTAEANPVYVKRVIEAGPDVMLVKLADLYNNTEDWRIESLAKDVQTRLRKKYYPAIWRIEQALISRGYAIVPTMSFEDAMGAVRPLSEPASPWKSKEGTSSDFGSIYVGDSIRLEVGAPEYEITARRTTAKGNFAIKAKGHTGEIVFVRGERFELRWKTGSYATWKDYMGLPGSWSDGDSVG